MKKGINFERTYSLLRICLLIVLATGVLFFIPQVLPSAIGVPSSERSRLAEERVTPGLKRALAAKNLSWGSPVFIRIFKETYELELWVENENGWELFKTYEICTYTGGLGPKLARGDRKSPEGFYFVNPARMNPWSSFHLSFDLGYPNAYDRSLGRTGAYLMDHGDCVSIGCYAMTDKSIEEIFTLASVALRNGQSFFRVHIFPFRMNEDNMSRHRGSPWYQFWKNLEEGYDFFEKSRTVPNVEVRTKRYVFSEGI